MPFNPTEIQEEFRKLANTRPAQPRPVGLTDPNEPEESHLPARNDEPRAVDHIIRK